MSIKQKMIDKLADVLTRGRKIQIRQGEAKDFKPNTLDVGEFGLITDENKVMIGTIDGTPMQVNGGGDVEFRLQGGKLQYFDGTDWKEVEASGGSGGGNGNLEGYQNSISRNATGNALGDRAKATGGNSFAVGTNAEASGYDSVSIGNACKATNSSTFSIGSRTTASGNGAFSSGIATTATSWCSFVTGQYNKPLNGSPDVFQATSDALVIGGGVSATKKNAFRVTFDGKTYGLSAFNSTGADYAEYFEWEDGNALSEDRVGYVVSLSNNKIHKATSSDSYILGVVSVNPSVIGDSHQDDWCNKYLTDEWERIQYHYVDTEYEDFDEEGNSITKTRQDYVPKLNPNWDSSVEYIPREKRKEWSPVGLMGKLLVRDDGTCQVNSFAKVGDVDGEVAHSDEVTNMRVMERVSDNIVRVFIK